MIYTIRGTDEFGDDLYAGMEDDGSIVLWGPSRKFMVMERATQDDPETYVHPTGFAEVRSDDPVYLGATMMMFTGMVPELVQGEPPEGEITFERLGPEPDQAVGAALVSAMIELACHSKECAPPPVGRGGSDHGAGTIAAVMARFPGARVNLHVTPEQLADISPDFWDGVAEAADRFPPEVRAVIDQIHIGLPEEHTGGLAAVANQQVDGRVENALIFSDHMLNPEGGPNPATMMDVVLFGRAIPWAKREEEGLNDRRRNIMRDVAHGKDDVEMTEEAWGADDYATDFKGYVRMIATHEMGHVVERLLVAQNHPDVKDIADISERNNTAGRTMTADVRPAGWPKWPGDRETMTEYGQKHIAEEFAEGVALAAIGHPLGAEFVSRIKDAGVDITSIVGSEQRG